MSAGKSTYKTLWAPPNLPHTHGATNWDPLQCLRSCQMCSFYHFLSIKRRIFISIAFLNFIQKVFYFFSHFVFCTQINSNLSIKKKQPCCRVIKSTCLQKATSLEQPKIQKGRISKPQGNWLHTQAITRRKSAASCSLTCSATGATMEAGVTSHDLELRGKWRSGFTPPVTKLRHNPLGAKSIWHTTATDAAQRERRKEASAKCVRCFRGMKETKHQAES